MPFHNIPFNVTSWIVISSMTAVACFLLFWRDSYLRKKLIEGREINEAGNSTDPIVVLINSDSNFSFAPVFTAPQSQLFDEKWLINSKTIDFNNSIMAVKLKVTNSTNANELHHEINRVARAACGGSFIRTQLVGCLIFPPTSIEINVEAIVNRSFGGRSGIVWAVLVNETDRAVVSARFDYHTRMDSLYSKILNWFREQNYDVRTEVIQNWITKSQEKGKLTTFLELFSRQE